MRKPGAKQAKCIARLRMEEYILEKLPEKSYKNQIFYIDTYQNRLYDGCEKGIEKLPKEIVYCEKCTDTSKRRKTHVVTYW